ncbi:MAG TPA: ATP-binding protein [Aggregatilineales bacterium]|nr:ATP-binding protein [Aggregatilineales bacterium]
MTFSTIVDWAEIAISLANTILLCWLGLTVLLNAERRDWGVGLIVVGLLLGAMFFVSHTAILGGNIGFFDRRLNIWWMLALAAVIAIPFVWYVVVLWYTGFWTDFTTPLHHRHRFGLALMLGLIAVLVGLLIALNPFPSFFMLFEQPVILSLPPNGIFLLIAVYTACAGTGIGLSLDALLRPGPSRRLMGDLARARARPWLLATSGTLLAIGALVAGVLFWTVSQNGRVDAVLLYNILTWLDLLIEGLISASILFLGQAVVYYEVFTGKTLPQRRFRRHWRNMVALAFGYGALMSGGFVIGLHPIYSLVLMALLLTSFYALFNHDSYIDRERYMRDLRPFVRGQNLFDHLIAGSVPAEVDVMAPFEALCRDVLTARGAYLVAVGPSAPLVMPLAYPAHEPIPAVSLTTIAPTDGLCVPVDPVRYGGALWAVPLWSERGLIGMLMLCEKSNSGLYTQEEIEIARATGERLIDTQATAAMSRRLMGLQRQRLAESSVIDRQARRVLHDDVLPTLHAAMLTLPAGESVTLLADAHRQIADLLHDMPPKVEPAEAGLIPALQRVLEAELRGAFDSVDWRIAPGAEQQAQQIPPLMTEVLYYAAREAIRNAARYGRGDHAALNLCVEIAWRDGLLVTIGDDGTGIDMSEGRGNGYGLALHSTMMAVIGGMLTVESAPGKFTRVVLSLPHEAWS